jgi:uncharacterized membrane protein
MPVQQNRGVLNSVVLWLMLKLFSLQTLGTKLKCNVCVCVRVCACVCVCVCACVCTSILHEHLKMSLENVSCTFP